MKPNTLDAWIASACGQQSRRRMRSAKNYPMNPLVTLSSCPELWENICSTLTGDSISSLANMRQFAEATKATWAWQLLSGLDNNANLVPWNDAENVLSRSYIPAPPHDDRNVFAHLSAYHALCKMPCPFFAHQVDGPARPSTPCTDYKQPERKLLRTHSPYCYVYVDAHERCDCTACNLNRPEDTGAPVFGIRPGFTYAPFWDVLIGGDHGDDGYDDHDADEDDNDVSVSEV